MKTLEQELSRIDLNLLVSLSVLIKEKNVSRAAEKLFLSQPAMSRILGRLRELFDDPLFYRESNGLQPTAKTLELEEQLDAILFSIDNLDTVVSDEYHSEKIGQTYPVIYGSADHPLLQKQHITIDDCLEYAFVDLSLDIRSTGEYLNSLDVELKKQGKYRNIALKSGQLSTLIESIKGTDRLIIGGHLLEKDSILDSSFKVIKTFDSKPYTVDIYLIEHRRTLTSPSHCWLKSIIIESIRSTFSNQKSSTLR
jgi:DNA-binding transcriptional LysR family regulator